MLWNNHRKNHRTFPAASLLALAVGAAILSPVSVRAETSAVSAPPTTTVRKSLGLKTAVVAATDTGGDADLAMRALKATNIAVARSTGYVVVPASQVAANLKKSGLRWPFVPREYDRVRSSLGKADRVVAVWVTPGDVSDASASVKALVEMYDTSNGGLVGRGEATYTATADSPALVSTMTTSAAPANSAPVLGSFEAPAGTASVSVDATTTTTTTTTSALAGDSALFLAADGAILRAVAQMNEPAEISGIIVSLPMQHMARLSLGEMHGLRNGTRIEYLVRGLPIAYGTVVDVGKGEALATVAPERAFPALELNSVWRTADIPSLGAAGLSRDQIDAKEWKKFQGDFGIGLAVAGLAYLLVLKSTD
jgi:hypothetical protein